VNAVFSDDAAYTGADKLVAVYAFAFQIYGDFSGYSDIARGLSKLMGFELMLNFNLPYFATNPSDFWRRWHISLSTWLRDYLYIPLGGSKRGSWGTYRNLFLTMLIGGIWHGASFMMVLWGVYHGLCLIVHRLLTGDRTRGREAERSRVVRFAQMALMFQITCLGWLIFRAESVGQIGRFLAGFVGDFRASPRTGEFVQLVLALVWPLAAYECWQYAAKSLHVFDSLGATRKAAFVVGVSMNVLLFLVLHRSFVQEQTPFIYFQF